jgi:hypothetical protein
MALIVEILFTIWLFVIVAVLGYGSVSGLWYVLTYQSFAKEFPELKGKHP